MKFVIVYWSRYGNNKKIVDYMAEKLQGEVQIFKTDETDPTKMPDADYYIFSAAAEAFQLQKSMKVFMKNIENMDGKKYGIINTHAMKKKNWLKKMEKPLAKKSMIKVAEIDFAMGKNCEAGDGLQEGWEAKLDEFCTKLK